MSSFLPGHLRLAFSTAADKPAIEALFDPAIKNTIDPDAQVAGRSGDMFEAHVTAGRAALLKDDQGIVHTLTIAWHLKDKDDQHPRPRHTEIGTALTRLPGFHSASPLIAALTLREWWLGVTPRGVMAGEVSDNNIPSLRLFRDILGWKPMKDRRTLKSLNHLSYAGVVNYDHKGDPKTWYQVDGPARQRMARILLNFMDRGSLVNRHSEEISLDMSTLEDNGLTRTRLEALAGGITTKKALRAIAPAVASR